MNKAWFERVRELFELGRVQTRPTGHPLITMDIMKPRMALDYICGTATLYEVFLWNSLYCLTTST